MRDAIGAVLRPAKDECAVEVCALQQRHEEIELLFGGHGVNRVCDRFRRRTAHANFHQLGIAQHPGGKPLNLRRQRRGKQKCLSICRNFFNDASHVRQKTHIQHAIHFIEDQNIHLLQSHRALFEQIEQPTRRRREDIDTAFEFVALFAVTHAPVHERDAQISEAAVIAKRGFDLRSQLAGRLDHQTSKRAVLREQRQNGKSKCRGLAGAGLRGSD